MHIQDISDLNPHSTGFANRAAESINIIGNVLEDLLNGFGGAISNITGSSHGSHLSLTNTHETNVFAEANPPPTPSRLRQIRAVDRTVPRGPSGARAVQDFIDKESMR